MTHSINTAEQEKKKLVQEKESMTEDLSAAKELIHRLEEIIGNLRQEAMVATDEKEKWQTMLNEANTEKEALKSQLEVQVCFPESVVTTFFSPKQSRRWRAPSRP